MGALLAAFFILSAAIDDMTGSKTSPSPFFAIMATTCRMSVFVVLPLSLTGILLSEAKAADIRPQMTAQGKVELKAILHESGISRLYKDLTATVITESRLARQTCEDSPADADKIQRFITKTLHDDQMMETSVEEMSKQIDSQTVDDVTAWMNSSTGRLILEAEARSADWSEDQFEQRESALSNDPNWNDARRALIVRVLKAASTVPFVTAMHTETSALVLQASDCIASEASRALINSRVQKARVDEAFYSVFLRKSMVMSAAVIFQGISDEDLEAYVNHNRTAAGQAWNDALLNAIRQVLRDRHAPLQYLLASASQG